jgi:tRNA(fMet)-specific endonuclease VapC
LTYGSLKHPDPNRHLQVWKAFAQAFEVLPFDEVAGHEHARIRFRLRHSPIGERDLLIAAIALPRKLTVVTHNRREFKRVPGLTVEDWTSG